ncbi:STAS domain-containing protein [Ideonella sp. DXS22W]|uniref:STAS domain-containing protein n=1 Tax=Pseudaquabacterium inlustre TaxID=2984192 RepID=A0ABU9CFG9_9BURK
MPAALRLDGELTIPQAAAVRERLLAVLDTAPDGLLLDLGEVEAFDSAGLQLLLATRHSLAERGLALTLTACSRPVADALRVYGLQALLPAPGDAQPAPAEAPVDPEAAT